MILIDTSIWVDHFRADDHGVFTLLNQGEVLMHPFVLGEVSMGSMKDRTRILKELRKLPKISVAQEREVDLFVTHHALFGRGIGYIDAHLLVAAIITPEVKLWTRDRRLHNIAETLGIAASSPSSLPN